MSIHVTSLAPWYGSNRNGAANVAYILQNCKVVAIPFAGGMSEVFELVKHVNQINVNDKHKHIINLAWCASDPEICNWMIKVLRRNLVHPESLAEAQKYIRENPEPGAGKKPDRFSAVAYFVCVWMGRTSLAGTPKEDNAPMAIRWTPGGDTAIKYQSAIRMLAAVRKAFWRCNYTCEDFREFLAHCYDEADSGIYCDPPFPDAGDGYIHSFSRQDHVDLEALLFGYTQAPVVVRYYDHPLVREIYTVTRGWKWLEMSGRCQANLPKPEVLILKNI